MTITPFSFTGKGKITETEVQPNWQKLTRLNQDILDDSQYYHTEDEGLVAAVNTALNLGMPLLLTGAPGVGKTMLAYRIAYELGCQTIFFPVKSDSGAQDLFYSIDHLRRLHAAQIEHLAKHNRAETDKEQNECHDPVDIRHFIRFQGLGLAILRAMPEERLQQLGLIGHTWPEQGEIPIGYGGQQPSVVLIDEIDKAPMDFCNDMLEEIRRLQFSIPELGSKPLSIYQNSDDPQEYEKQYRPQIIITSNSEKGLPEPFLRRCVYYHIQPPSRTTLNTILQNRLYQYGTLGDKLDSELKKKSLDFFLYLRDQANLEKAPSTAELLNWFLIMGEHRQELDKPDTGESYWLKLAGFCLLKYQKDQQQITNLFDIWKDTHASS